MAIWICLKSLQTLESVRQVFWNVLGRCSYTILPYKGCNNAAWKYFFYIPANFVVFIESLLTCFPIKAIIRGKLLCLHKFDFRPVLMTVFARTHLLAFQIAEMSQIFGICHHIMLVQDCLFTQTSQHFHNSILSKKYRTLTQDLQMQSLTSAFSKTQS